jgi:DNA-binding winged helix-turn-helix (wHTH) protein
MKRVWPDAFVEEGNLNKNIFFLRKVLGEWDGRE